MAWNFANWYVPLIEGCCHGTNVPVPYEDGMTFLESNESIITIVNQLIDNNNEIPDIIKEEVKTELRAFVQSQEGIDLIKSVIPSATTTTEGTVKLIYTIPETASPALNVLPTVNGIRNYVSDKIASLGNVLDFKGVKTTQAELPTTGNTVGDVWYVEATKSAWAWVKDSTDPNGRWDEFGPVIDLSPYFKKSDITQTTGNSTTKVMSQKATTNAINATEYTLPVASAGTLGGVIAPVKTSAETEQVHVDAQGKMWVKPSSVTVNPSTTTPKMDDTATVGTETKYARGDHVHPKDTSKVDKVSGKGLSTNDYTNADKTKLAEIAPNANNYTLPIANSTTLGGVMAGMAACPIDKEPVCVDAEGKMWSKRPDIANPTKLGIVKGLAKTDAETEQVHIDLDGNMWVKPSNDYTLPPATNISLGGVIVSNQGTEIPVGYGSLRTQATETGALKVLLPFATADRLGGIKADESSEAMPVEIAIDPTTHKLKGALMTAYNSPTQIGGVVKNGVKTNAETQPVVMDSNGKQWVKAGVEPPQIQTTLPASGTALTVNTIYNIPTSSPVVTYQFVAPTTGHIHGRFRTGNNTFTLTITFGTGAKFLAEAPGFEPDTEYEFDVLDNVWVFAKVV